MTNSYPAQLQEHRTFLLRRIAEAAQRTEAAAIHAGSVQLQAIDALLTEYNRLDTRAKALLKTAPDEVTEGSAQRTSARRFRVPGRGHGIAIRAAFLEKAQLRGLDLQPLRGSIFRNRTGTTIGIAVATERRPDRWFLGLPQDAFDAAILLCRDDLGKMIEIALPPPFIAKYGSHLSRSGGQVKFNVIRRANQISLVVPTQGEVNVDQYVDGLDAVTP